MGGRERWLSGAMGHPPFVVAAVVLLSAVILRGPVADLLHLAQKKAAVPLKKPLSDLNRDELGEYRFVRVSPLDDAVVDALGTDAFISWDMIDTSIKRIQDPRRYVRCFISYYTGSPSMVPHIPDHCFLGAGYQRTAASNLVWNLPSDRAKSVEVPARVVTFVKSGVFEKAEPTVVYTFHCNGKFVNTRNSVRARLGDPFAKGAYFCKVEITFGGGRSLPASPTREQAIQSTRKFLTRLLPVLLRDHLPDWQAVQNPKAKAV